MKINNMDTRTSVLRKEEFTAHSIFSRRTKDVYAVYSWGNHFPMYAFDFIAGYWIGNKDKYSRSTTKHQSLCRPPEVKHWFHTKELIDCVDNNGIAGLLAYNITGSYTK